MVSTGSTGKVIGESCHSHQSCAGVTKLQTSTFKTPFSNSRIYVLVLWCFFLAYFTLMLGAGAWDDPEGWYERKGERRESSGWGTRVYLRPFMFNLTGKTIQNIVINLQIRNIFIYIFFGSHLHMPSCRVGGPIQSSPAPTQDW